MLSHIPWKPILGGSRPQIELEREFTRFGHKVVKFDCDDAFGNKRPNHLAQLFGTMFSARAMQYVQRNAPNFDIIEALPGVVSRSKRSLGFGGLLVTRSIAPHFLTREMDRKSHEMWPNQPRGKPLGRAFRALMHIKEDRHVRLSYEVSDLINVPNQDEANFLRDVMGYRNKSVVLPFGLSLDQLRDYQHEALSPAARLASAKIVFIGRWSTLKGTRDWPRIISNISSSAPKVSFLFLGTWASRDLVLKDLQLEWPVNVEVIPHYENAQLPKLLGSATLGAFPSYMEGFPFAVLEKLAAGLPTVAYDVPGPRETLPYINKDLMIPPGDTDRFSARLLRLLSLTEPEYAELSRACSSLAQRFTWPEIAKDTLSIYREALSQLQTPK